MTTTAKAPTTRTVTLADVQEGDIVFKFGRVLSSRPLIVSRVTHTRVSATMTVTMLRYDNGGFTMAHPSTDKVVLSVHRAERVEGPVTLAHCEECFYLVADCKCAG